MLPSPEESVRAGLFGHVLEITGQPTPFFHLILFCFPAAPPPPQRVLSEGDEEY